MPYSNPKQPVAAFLDIKRRQGLQAARAFADRHKADMKRGAQSAARSRSSKAYRPRGRRSK